MDQRRKRRIERQITKTYVNLQQQKISDDQVQHLFDEKDTSQVEKCNLGKNRITAIGLSHFRNAKWGSLTFLDLGGNMINNQGCKYLSKASMNNLRQILLDNGKLGSQGVSHLTKGKWKQLKAINLAENPISCNALNHISKANWKHLNRIYFCDNSITGPEFLQLSLFQIIIEKFNLHIYIKRCLIQKWEEKGIQKAIQQKIGGDKFRSRWVRIGYYHRNSWMNN